MLLFTALGLGQLSYILNTKIIHWWLHLAHVQSLTYDGHKNEGVHHKSPNLFP